jgi:hypothetical protein
MKKNIGSADRIIRVVTAIIFLALTLTGMIGGIIALVLSVVGIVLVVTSFIGYCPLYVTLGISTIGQNEDIEHDGVN